MNRFSKKIIGVCDNCKTASCYYGEFMCENSRAADIELWTVRDLRKLKLENEDNFSDEKMIKIYGDPAPFWYVS